MSPRSVSSSRQPFLNGLMMLLFAVGLFFVVSGAQANSLSPQQVPDQTTYAANELGRLRQLAATHDGISVIVRLSSDYSPEGRLGPSRIENQRAEIQSAQESLLSALDTTEYRVNRRYRTFPSIALTLSPESVDVLANNTQVDRIQLDVLYRPMLDESVPHVQADQLHEQGDEGQNFMTVIVDSGIDDDHDAFGGRVTAEACFARGEDEDPTTGGDCPNGEAEMTGDGAGVPLLVGGDPHFHGTHVGGIAAAAATTEVSDGMATAADVGSIQVFSEITDSTMCAPDPAPCLSSHLSDILAALDHVNAEWVDEHDLASVNMSLGGSIPHSTSCDEGNILTDPIDSLRAMNVATVIASGNNDFTNGISDPACISSAVAVGSTNINNAETISSFSNQHPDLVDLVAPGTDITSAVPGGGSGELSGTSMAAPHVAGAWALLRQATGATGVGEIEQALIETGEPVEDQRSGAPSDAEYRSIRLVAASDELDGGGAVAPSDEFVIAPNPYRPNDGNPKTGDEDSGIHFANLPENFEVSIYMLTGEEVVSERQQGSDGRWIWGGRDRYGDPVASGYYLVNVEDRDSGETDQRKLAVIR